MDKHTEIIFNLFILNYFNYSFVDEDTYNCILSLSEDFKLQKSCFPENEIACQTLVSGQYEIDFHCNLIQEQKTTVAKARKIKTAKYNKTKNIWEY